MKHKNHASLLYFSLNPERRLVFWHNVKKRNINYALNADFIYLQLEKYNHCKDLYHFIEQYTEDLQSLYVIVDIESIYTIIDNKDKAQEHYQIEDIRNLVLSFPEVHFLFDISNESDLCLFLFPDEKKIINQYKDKFPQKEWEDIKTRLNTKLISFPWHDPLSEHLDDLKLFYLFIAGRDNTFDASNLRYVLKNWKYITLKVGKRNYSLIQNSRATHLAICIEEEAQQNSFNSYALYKNGYRVLPVTSALELRQVNKQITEIKQTTKEEVLIVRDYDLQFEDEGEDVNKIRGYKYCTKEDLNEEYNYKVGWNDLQVVDGQESRNLYWNNLNDYQKIYISKGHENFTLKAPISECEKGISEDKSKIVLEGIYKPVSGIYYPFHKIDSIRTRFTKTRQNEEMRISRLNHNHSTPLDIFDMTNLMISRAEAYYDKGKYRLAALISSEAIEILNGFHQRLMIKAHYINAKSENAIAMDIVGGDELYLSNDTRFRIQITKDFINRLHLEGQERNNSGVNILNQIFNDCRQYCKEKEHYLSEEEYIRAIACLNEGVPLSQFTSSIMTCIKRINMFIRQEYHIQTEKMINKQVSYIFYLSRKLFNLLDKENYSKDDIKSLKRNKRKYYKLTNSYWEKNIIHLKEGEEKKIEADDLLQNNCNNNTCFIWKRSNDNVTIKEQIIKGIREGRTTVVAKYKTYFKVYQVVISKK